MAVAFVWWRPGVDHVAAPAPPRAAVAPVPGIADAADPGNYQLFEFWSCRCEKISTSERLTVQGAADVLGYQQNHREWTF